MPARPRPPRAVLETALYARDLERTARFYIDVIGLTEDSRVDGRHVFLRCDASMVLIFNPDATQQTGGRFPVPPHGATGEGHICFRADPGEMNAWETRLKEQAVEIEADFQWPNGARSIYLRDPAQNSVEFAEASLWGFSS